LAIVRVSCGIRRATVAAVDAIPCVVVEAAPEADDCAGVVLGLELRIAMLDERNEIISDMDAFSIDASGPA